MKQKCRIRNNRIKENSEYTSLFVVMLKKEHIDFMPTLSRIATT
jgi:hypothetical protein